MKATRTSLDITLAVWKALFLREAVTRISKNRTAWVWLFLEPVYQIAWLIVLHTIVRMRIVNGMGTVIWILVGLLAFYMFKRPAQQSMNAVNANEALFNFRQVKPVDTVLVRAAIEGFLTIILAIVCFCFAGLIGIDVIPADPLTVLVAFFGMWLAGLGFGLLTSVITELVPEAGHVLEIAMTPLYIISGVIFPLGVVPEPYRSWLLLNPLIHGLECVRLAYVPYYDVLPGMSLVYLYIMSLVAIFLGLALHYRFEERLVMQ